MTENPPPPAAAGPLSEPEDVQYASFAHLGVIIPIATLIIWLIYKDRGPKTNVEGKEALNFVIWMIIASVAGGILNIILGVIPIVQFLTLITAWAIPLGIFIVTVIFAIQGFNAVKAGGSYRYPIGYPRLIK